MTDIDIPLGQDTERTATNYLKLPEVGQYFDCHIAHQKVVPAYEFNKDRTAERRQKVTIHGKPKTQDMVTVVVTGGNATLSTADGERPAEPGDVAVWFFEGPARWDPKHDGERPLGAPKSWGAAKDDRKAKHGATVRIGDFMRVTFTDIVQGDGAQPRKFRLVQIRPSKPEESAARDQAVATWRTIEDSAAPAMTSASAPSSYDDF